MSLKIFHYHSVWLLCQVLCMYGFSLIRVNVCGAGTVLRNTSRFNEFKWWDVSHTYAVICKGFWTLKMFTFFPHHTIKAGHHRHWTHFAFWQWSQPNSHCLKELLFYKSPATDDVPLNPIKDVGIKWSSRSLISDDIWTNLPTGILKNTCKHICVV